MVARTNQRAATRVRALLPSVTGCLVLAAGLACAWHYTDLEEFTSISRVASAARSLRDSPLGPLYVVLAFVVGATLFVPSTVLIAGTALAFGSSRGFACALAGCVLSAAVGYGAGRLLGRRLLSSFTGERFERLRLQLCTRAFRATLIARLLPVANFHALNLLAGSLGVPFRRFFLGNFVGVLPYVALFSLFAHRFHRLLAEPSVQSLGWLVASVLVLGGLGFALQRWLQRQQAEE